MREMKFKLSRPIGAYYSTVTCIHYYSPLSEHARAFIDQGYPDEGILQVHQIICRISL